MKRRSLKITLKYTAIGIIAIISSLMTINSVMGQTVEPLPKNDKPEITYNIDGSQDWDGKDRHWHVQADGDTIVSYLNKEQAKIARDSMEKQMGAKGANELEYDVTDPSFGLVPQRPGNDTIPLQNDIAVKNMENKIVKLEANIEENPVDQINASTSGWVCSQYATQTANIDFFGVYDINNSTLNSGATLPFNFETNGTGENPSYVVTTTTTSGVPHAICGNFIGTENFQDFDVTNFDQWYFWEPQTDERIFPGDYSMDANEPIKIKWYGYTEHPSIGWMYISRNILKFDLDDGNATNTFTEPDLTTYWDPFNQTENPETTTQEFPADTTVAANGSPENVYAGAVYSYSDVSNQTSNGTASDVNYAVTRTWEGEAGDYNSSNTPSATYVQMINVEDTTPPVRDSEGNWSDNSNLEVMVTTDTTSTQGEDPSQCNYYTYTETATETAEDLSGNEAQYEHDPVEFVNQVPYIVSTPVLNGDTIYVPLGGDIHPDSTGWAEWADPENGPIAKYYDDVVIEEDDVHVLYHRTQTAEDPCEASPDEANHYIYKHKPTRVRENAKKKNAFVYPNPTNGNFKLHYNKSGNVVISIYNANGQKLEENDYESLLSGTDILFSLHGKTSGVYFLKIQDETGATDILKFIFKSHE